MGKIMVKNYRLFNLLFLSLLFIGIELCAEELTNKDPIQLSENRIKEIKELIQKLGDNDWQIRESAQKRIIEFGKAAEPWLQEALKNKDPEIRIKARQLLDQIKEDMTCIIEGELWAHFIGDSLPHFHVPYFNEKGIMVCVLSCLKGPIQGVKSSCVNVPPDATIIIKDTQQGKTAVFSKGSAKKIEEIVEESPREPRISDIKWLKSLLKKDGFQFLIKDDLNAQTSPLKENQPCTIEGRLIWENTSKFDEPMPYTCEELGYSMDCLPRGFVKCLPNSSPSIDSEDTLSIKNLKTGQMAVFAKGSTKRIDTIIEEFKREPRISDIKWFDNLVNNTSRILSSSFQWINKDQLNLRNNLINTMNQTIKSEQRYKNASLTILNGVPLLKLSGTPEEIGTQYGTILKDILRNIPSYLKLSDFNKNSSTNTILHISKTIDKYLPPDIREEMQAITKASGIDYETLLMINIIPNFYNLFESGVVACESKSIEKTPVFGGNINLFNNPIVPRDIQLVVVYHVKGKKSFASITFPGMLGCFTGINEHGLCLGNILVSNAKDNPELEGLPSALVNRSILENASNIEEASRIIEKSERITPGNLILCDENTTKVIEYSPSQIFYRLPNKDTLFATNYFFTEEMSYSKVSQNEWGLELLLSTPEIKITIDRMKFIMNSIALEDSVQCLIFLPSKRSFQLSSSKLSTVDNSLIELNNAVLFGK
jgi:isopenicillin-N N-acyltransferase like protein